MKLNPRTEIIQPFDIAQNLYDQRDEAFKKIDKMIEILNGIEVEEITGGFFYNCKDTPGLCDYDDNAKVYISPHQFSSVKNEDYKSLIVEPITSKLFQLGSAMATIDTNYPLLYQISNYDQIKEYEEFKKRINQVTLYVRPDINEKEAPHLNAINYLSGLKIIIENNLPEVLAAYNHHVETLRETY